MNSVEIFLLVIAGIITCLIIAIVLLTKANARMKQENEIAKANAQNKIASMRSACEQEKEAAYAACERDKAALKAENAEVICVIKKDCEQQIQHVREQIEGRKDVLSKMSEKDLLVEAMVALKGYSGRLERIENYLAKNVATDKIEELSQTIDSKIEELAQSVAEHLEEMNAAIDESLENSDILDFIQSIDSNVEEIKADISKVKSDVEELDTDPLSDMWSVKTTVESISSQVNNIYSSISDQYGYDSLASKIDSINSSAQQAVSAAEDAKSAAEGARMAIESHY